MTPFYLVSSIDGKVSFAWADLEQVLRQTGKVLHWRPDTELQWATTTMFSIVSVFRDEQIEIDVDDSLRVMTLMSKSDAALEYALTLQQGYGREIFIFEGDNISGAIALSGVSGASDLRMRLSRPAVK